MKRNTKQCPKCNKEISLSNYDRHFSSCGNRSKKVFVIDENWKNNNGQYQCPICEKEFSRNGIIPHIIFKHNKPRNGKNHPKYGKSGENSWSIAKKNGVKHIMSEKQKEYFTSEKCYNHLRKVGDDWWKNPESLNKFKKSIREAIKRNPEAYSANNVCGRTKLIEYNGFKLNGTWELEVGKWLDKHNIKWTNIIKNGFEYVWENNVHLYFPDFYLIDYGIYIEVKGYERKRDRCKWSVVDNLIILKKNEIKEIRNGTYIAQW